MTTVITSKEEHHEALEKISDMMDIMEMTDAEAKVLDYLVDAVVLYESKLYD